MIALDTFLAGIPHDEQLNVLNQLREAIPARLRSLAAERVRALVPRAVRVTWTGDVSSSDDGTTTPYLSSLAVVLEDGQTVSLPVESDLGCGVDWWEGMDFSGFADTESEDAFYERLHAAASAGHEQAAAEGVALVQIAARLGVADVRPLIGALTNLAEEDPFGESCDLPPASPSRLPPAIHPAAAVELLSALSEPAPNERFDDDTLSQAIDLLYLLAELRPSDPRFRRITWPMIQVAAKGVRYRITSGSQG